MIVHNTIWKPIPSFEGYYTNIYGDVLSLKERKPLGLRKCLDSKGYEVVNLGGTIRRVHRLVAETFMGLDYSNPHEVVMHIDDDPTNNNIYNLRVGTQTENVRDMIEKGRGKYRYKITPEQLLVLRVRLKNGERGRALAEEYGVSESLISNIRNNVRRTDG